MDDVTLIEPSGIQISAHRWKYAQLPVRARLVRESLPAEFRLGRVSVDPATVLVRLPYESDIDEAATEWIDLSDLRESTTVHPRLTLPPRTQYLSPEQGELRVHLEIERRGPGADEPVSPEENP